MSVVERPARGQARRAYDQLVAATIGACAEYGAQVGLSDIERRAGVAAGPLFTSREALLDAAYDAQVTAICTRAVDLASSRRPEQALTLWLRDFMTHLTTRQTIARALLAATGRDNPVFASGRTAIRRACGGLLTTAQLAGAVRSDVTVAELLRLVQSVAVASEYGTDQANRLLTLLVDGLRERD